MGSTPVISEKEEPEEPEEPENLENVEIPNELEICITSENLTLISEQKK